MFQLSCLAYSFSIIWRFFILYSNILLFATLIFVSLDLISQLKLKLQWHHAQDRSRERGHYNKPLTFGMCYNVYSPPHAKVKVNGWSVPLSSQQGIQHQLWKIMGYTSRQIEGRKSHNPIYTLSHTMPFSIS